MFAIIPIRLNPKWLIITAILRLLLVPLMLLCVTPSPTHPVASSYSLVLSSILIVIVGASNGYISTLGMKYPPTMVADSERELTGNRVLLMTSQILGPIH